MSILVAGHRMCVGGDFHRQTKLHSFSVHTYVGSFSGQPRIVLAPLVVTFHAIEVYLKTA